MCFCYRIPAPLMQGVPTKTRFQSSMKNFKLHAMYDWCFRPSLGPPSQSNTHWTSKWLASNIWIRDVFFTQHLWCRGSQPKHVSNPDSVTKKFNPNFIYDRGFRPSSDRPISANKANATNKTPPKNSTNIFDNEVDENGQIVGAADDHHQDNAVQGMCACACAGATACCCRLFGVWLH